MNAVSIENKIVIDFVGFQVNTLYLKPLHKITVLRPLVIYAFSMIVVNNFFLWQFKIQK